MVFENRYLSVITLRAKPWNRDSRRLLQCIFLKELPNKNFESLLIALLGVYLEFWHGDLRNFSRKPKNWPKWRPC